MLVRLIEIQRGSSYAGYSSRLNEVYLNPAHIISIMEDSQTNERTLKEAVALGLPDNISFSRVTINEGNVPRTLTIVGSPAEVHQKLAKKQILRG